MGRFLGQVPGDRVEELWPYLSTSENVGRCMAEELFRDEHTRPVMLKIISGGGRNLTGPERASLPALLGTTWEVIVMNFVAGE